MFGLNTRRKLTKKVHQVEEDRAIKEEQKETIIERRRSCLLNKCTIKKET